MGVGITGVGIAGIGIAVCTHVHIVIMKVIEVNFLETQCTLSQS